jgi:hypothetical protein
MGLYGLDRRCATRRTGIPACHVKLKVRIPYHEPPG